MLEVSSSQASNVADEGDVSALDDELLSIDSDASAVLETAVAVTMDEAVALGLSQHPLLQVRQGQIAMARAAEQLASTPRNPNFVVDWNAPLGDRGDPHEIGMRLTFPFHYARERAWRMAAARTGVRRSQTVYDAQLQELEKSLWTTLIETLYLQRQTEYLDERCALLEQRVRATDVSKLPTQDESAVGPALLRWIEAQADLAETKEQILEAQRKLVVLQSTLAAWLNRAPGELVTVTDTDFPTFEDPGSLDESLDRARREVAQLQASELQALQARQVAAAEASTTAKKDIGPRYQDRVGRDDDSIGIRFQSDLWLFPEQLRQTQRAQATAQTADQQRQVLERRIETRIVQAYRELEILREQVYRQAQDPFVKQQNDLLASATAAKYLTAAQTAEVRLMLLDRKLQLLKMQERMALLQIDLWLPIPQFNEFDPLR